MFVLNAELAVGMIKELLKEAWEVSDSTMTVPELLLLQSDLLDDIEMVLALTQPE